MSKLQTIQNLEQKRMKTNIPTFSVGDTISVHVRIIEGNKERIQVFTGTVIARKGSGISETFSVHRIAYGEGMERVFPLHSPRIAKIEVVKKGRVRRGKLYYLRGKTGKAARVKGSERVLRVDRKQKKQPIDSEKVEEAKKQQVGAEEQRKEPEKTQERKEEETAQTPAQ